MTPHTGIDASGDSADGIQGSGLGARRPGSGMGMRTDTPEASALVTRLAWGGACLFVASLTFFLYSYVVRFGANAPNGSRLRPIVIDLLLFSGFALHHSLFARTPFKAWVRRVLPPVLERSFYTSIASVLFVIVCWSWQPVPGVLYRLEPPWRSLAVAAQLAGVLFTILGARALDVLDLAGVRQALGGRAAHHPLTTAGVYAVVRHPLYFGWALVVCGAPGMTATRALFALVSTAYCAVAIPWEERGLLEAFGADYEAYRRKVRWKMLPGVY